MSFVPQNPWEGLIYPTCLKYKVTRRFFPPILGGLDAHPTAGTWHVVLPKMFEKCPITKINKTSAILEILPTYTCRSKN